MLEENTLINITKGKSLKIRQTVNVYRILVKYKRKFNRHAYLFGETLLSISQIQAEK